MTEIKLPYGVYILAQQEDWQNAMTLGYWQTESLLSRGFIHAASHEQVSAVYIKHFAGQGRIHLLKIDEASLVDYLHWDAHPVTAELFPHIYCALPLASIERVIDWPMDAKPNVKLTLCSI